VRVTLKIYDVSGREVKTVVNERQAARNHSATLNASGLASGVYFYQLQTNGKALAKKLMVIRILSNETLVAAGVTNIQVKSWMRGQARRASEVNGFGFRSRSTLPIEVSPGDNAV